MRCYISLDIKKEEQRLFIDKSVKKFGTIKKLAQASSIKPRTLSRYKYGSYRISLKDYKKICKICNIIIDKKIKLIKEGLNKKELNFIIKNYKKLTAKEIAIKLNKSIDSVKYARKSLNLYKGPKYRWTKKNVINSFKNLKKKLGYTPSYKECEKYNSGMLSGIITIWKKYSLFLKELGLNIRIKYWSKDLCIQEFDKIKEKINKIPTQTDLKSCHGLFKAIINRWKTYNIFLKEIGYNPNFEYKWTKDYCVKFFEEFMKKREVIPSINEIYGKCGGFIGGMYRHYGSYSNFLNILGYPRNPDAIWVRWEDFVTKLCKEIYKNIIIKPKLPNNKIPDIAVGNSLKYPLIVEIKINSYAQSIIRDFYNYTPYCKELEFWCCYGDEKRYKKLSEKGIKIVTLDKIESMVNNLGNKELIEELEAFKNVR